MSGRIHKKKSKLTSEQLRIRGLKSILKQVQQAIIETGNADIPDAYSRLLKLERKIENDLASAS